VASQLGEKRREKLHFWPATVARSVWAKYSLPERQSEKVAKKVAEVLQKGVYFALLYIAQFLFYFPLATCPSWSVAKVAAAQEEGVSFASLLRLFCS